ncbi:hypothetical protein SLEP1_g26503 [Rubroshorea leprosula]|uniref:Uncharacterized protein n=1 Tax=Rubroshorea leprosula TaxID=152421 RepID=A0AAV5JTC3_9ROSI|nr:hypothetical protein SLEP1_g26503 [Rubroshorea leprosula]
MRNCYDSLLSAAAVTANCAYGINNMLHDQIHCLDIFFPF